jgi:ubiquinone/menaquinone biosynthesis C-methylase UbiE
MRFLRRGGDPYAFAATMIGVKMGDRLLQAGCGDGGLLAALAAKVGLTGRACGVDDSPEALARAQAAADRAGVLVELQRASYGSLPFDPHSFDVAIVHDVLRKQAAEARAPTAAGIVGLLRPGGRCIVVDTAPRGGLGALLGGGAKPDPLYVPEDLLRAAGCKAVRRLAEREGLVFVEGVKGRDT